MLQNYLSYYKFELLKKYSRHDFESNNHSITKKIKYSTSRIPLERFESEYLHSYSIMLLNLLE